MRLPTIVAAAVVLPLTLAVAGARAQPPKVNPEAALLKDFTSRIDAYLSLHNKLEKKAPPLEQTKNPGDIQASQDALAAQIRAARRHAKQGDIFTPEIAAALKRLMYPETKGAEGIETRKAIKDDAPAKGTPITVNGRYPSDEPLPTVPPNILAALPPLPEELEYRVVHDDLILRDVHANLIVDYIPNAIQPASAASTPSR